MFDLTGDVAVVTGAGTGLGRQFALALARQGADVALLGRRQEKIDAVAEEIRALGRKALPVSTDVTNPEAVRAARDKIVKEFGKVTILVNDAGGGIAGNIESLADEDWQKNRALDFDGVFYCMKYFGQNMLEHGYGRVINIASILGKGGLPELPIIGYCACKGGVINMTRHAAAEWCRKGITVNAICPGFFASEANSPAAMKAMDGFITARTPMGRPGNPGELDSTVVYLAAHESSYVTGSICACDGGWTCV
jgi:NAD(P)-dependent dehydrogenase (short-subunit alcohol dehydrogenase family)